MQILSCEYWAIEQKAFSNFLELVSTIPSVAKPHPSSRREKVVGVIPIHGPIESRSSWLGEYLGISSYESIGYQLDKLMADDSVKSVVFDIYSPGGMAAGAPELAEKIYSYRGVKPMLAVANHMAASGAYWVGAAADRLVVTPSGDVGSVGVIATHVDFSKADERLGVKRTVIRSTNAPHKAETNSDEPLSEEAYQATVKRMDEIHRQFASDLARFRGVSVKHVNEHFGRGRLVSAKQAIKAGMADRVDTLESILIKSQAGRIRISSNRTEDFILPSAKERFSETIKKIEKKID